MNIRSKTLAKMALSFLVIVFLAIALTGSVSAGDFRGGDTIVIPAGEVIDDDLFIAGNRVEINGTVTGDLFATGAMVTVNGDVGGSLFIAGQTLEVNGKVDGSVYGGGYAITVGSGAEIGRNIYFGGFSLSAEPESSIGRSVYAGNYQTILDGDVAHDVNVSGAALEVNGSVGGDVTGEVSVSDADAPPPFMPAFPGSVPMVAPGLRVSESADIGGEVSVKEVVQQSGRTNSAGSAGAAREWAGQSLTTRIGEFIALLIVGLLLLQFLPAMVLSAGNNAQEKPFPSAGYGCLVTLVFAIAVPVATLALFIVALLGGLITFGQLFGVILGIGGAALALIITSVLFVISLVSKVVVSFLSGRLLLKRFAPQMEPGKATDFWSLALGAFIYEILRAIPFGVGWVIGVIVTVVGVGAIYYAVIQHFGLAKTEPPEAPPQVEATV